jgi:beta-xylosidase
MPYGRIVLAIGAVLAMGVSSAATPSLAGAAAGAAASTYTNPVSAGAVDTFPDPAMIRGKDGYWYAYGTTNPILLSHGDGVEHTLPMLRSPDLVTWTYLGDAYTLANRPSWWPAGTRPWAPDIRYVDGTYHLTYSLSGGGIALATASRPGGPWTDRGLLVPGDADASGCPTFDIDQAMYTDITTGAHYLYWGSYDTICVQQLDATATARVGPVTQVARGRRMEGGFVVRRDGWYYLFYSDAGCCDGAFSGYTVKVGRADSPLGPFRTPSGRNLMDLTSKDGIVLAGTGNGWIGPGHNAVQTDLSGQDWLVYHAIPASNPDFPPVTNQWGGTMNNLSRRPLMIDRLDWIGGWPVVRAGAGTSTGPQPAPVTTWTVGSTFNGGLLSGWGTNWSLANDPDSAGHVSYSGTPASYFLSNASVSGNLRVEADIRLGAGNTTGAVGLVVSYTDANNNVVAWVDRAQRRLVVEARSAGVSISGSSPLPDTFSYATWHNIAAERRGTTLVTWVTADRLRDAVSTVTITLPSAATAAGRIGAASRGGATAADNIGAAPLYQPVTSRVPNPVPGDLLPAYSDEFDGTGRPETGNPAWRWVRGANATADKSGGFLVWPTQAADLYTGTNTASVLLRDAPPGNFMVETRLQFDGTLGNQQAGLVLYDDDDRYVKLTHTVLPLAHGGGAVLHVTEFGKEAERPTTTPPTPVAYGPMFGGPAAAVTWLRLAYRYDTANGEHEVRMASSTDGTNWTWGGTWSTTRVGALRIGLVSMNRTGATARFDYLRTYALP